MKKVLFITYFWPPSGKATVHWPLYIVKYLPRYGWKPSVLTAEGDIFSSIDESLLREISQDLKIIRTKSRDPFNFYRKFIGKKKHETITASESISSENKSITHRISIWIRMNLFVPDARVGWYFPGKGKGKLLLEEHHFDAIVSIGPPHTAHLIGRKLSREFLIPHFPVFIDPWVDIVYYKNFRRSRLTLMLDNYFEREVLKNAAAAVFVTRTMKEDYQKKYDFLEQKSDVLYWGYNEENFSGLPEVMPQNEEVIVHAGNIFDYQNIPAFWQTVAKEINNGRKLKLRFIGTVSPAIKNAIIKAGLENHTQYLGFLPYNDMLIELQKANYLLVCATEKRHVPGKLFEYLRIGKPIIAFGDDNTEVGEIINRANAGMLFKYKEDCSEFFRKSSSFIRDIKEIKKYDRNEIAQSLSILLDEMTKKLDLY